MKVRIALVLCLMFLSSCHREHLYVSSNYMTHKDLASYHVGTPDPRKDSEWAGQRLIVGWSVYPDMMITRPDLRMRVHVRYGNREEMIKEVPIIRSHGKYIYKLMNDDFFEKKGILTYQIKLVYGEGSKEVEFKKWTHQLWTSLIDVDKES